MARLLTATRALRFSVILCTLMLFSCAGYRNVGEQRLSTVKILHVNDIHSFLEPEAIDLVLDHEKTTVEVGGMARVAGLIRRLARNSENCLVLHAGDEVQGTLYYTLFGGRADADVMNAVGFDAMALGNHEFDNGDTSLAAFIDRLDAPVVSANIKVAPGSVLEHHILPYIIRKIAGGRIGIIGLTPGRVTRNSSRPGEDVSFTDEVGAVQAAVDELAARGVRRIILLSHYGYRNDLSLAGKVTDVDVIVDGHSHTLLGDYRSYGLVSDGPYPTVTRNADGDPVCVVQAWEHGRILGELDVTFQGDVLSSWNGTPHLILGNRFSREDGGGKAHELEGDALKRVIAAVNADPKVDIPAEDASVAAVIAGYSGKVNAIGKTVIGTAGEDLPHIRVPGITHGGVPLPQGSDIAPLVARAFFERDSHADLCIQNAGGVRIGIKAGDISYSTVYEMLPFSNTLFEIEMTGAQIHQVLEDALEYIHETGATGAFPYAYGLKYDVDATQAYGRRVSGLEVKDRTTGLYAPLSESARYVVATSNYLAEGRDGYAAFAEARKQGAEAVDTYIDYALAFVSYVKKLTAAGQSLKKLPAEDRCIKNFIPLVGKNDGSSR